MAAATFEQQQEAFYKEFDNFPFETQKAVVSQMNLTAVTRLKKNRPGASALCNRALNSGFDLVQTELEIWLRTFFQAFIESPRKNYVGFFVKTSLTLVILRLLLKLKNSYLGSAEFVFEHGHVIEWTKTMLQRLNEPFQGLINIDSRGLLCEGDFNRRWAFVFADFQHFYAIFKESERCFYDDFYGQPSQAYYHLENTYRHFRYRDLEFKGVHTWNQIFQHYQHLQFPLNEQFLDVFVETFLKM